MWQPWLLRPSLSQFVTSPCPGYANRLNRAIDGMGTCTPLDAQPCRLLPELRAGMLVKVKGVVLSKTPVAMQATQVEVASDTDDDL